MKIISQVLSNIRQEFGESFHIDIQTGFPRIYNDELFLHTWVFDLVDEIGMKILDGNLQLKYYKGRDEKTEGFSGIAFLDCSSISIHCSEYYGRVYLDIFSCKKVDIKRVTDYINQTIKSSNIINYVKLNR